MKQHEAVIKAMSENGGYATLGHLYSAALKIPDVEWKTKTPFASIRRIVQDKRFFLKIRPGLWALREFRHGLPESIILTAKETKEPENTHAYYQGLLVEIGNLKNYDTFVPSQDKNKCFLTKPLSDYVKIHAIHPFTYEYLVKRAQTIDVVWFNDRKMPHSFF